MTEDFDGLVKVLKARWNAAGKEVRNIDGAGQAALISETDVIVFKGLFHTLEKYYTKCEEIWDKIEDAYDSHSKSGDFPTVEETEVWKKVRSSYRQAYISYEKILKLEKNESIHHSVSEVGMPANITLNDSRTSSNLPRISLPKFDGNFSTWPKFRDTFSSLVDREESLSDMAKFHYLTSSLIGNAASIINSFSLEDRNYKLALKALMDVYDNKRLLAYSYLNQLLQFKPYQGKANVASLMTFLSKIADTISALKLLEIPHREEFVLFYLAFRCLDSHTKEQFELANKAVEFPTFDNLIKYVRDKCTALQLSEGNLDFSTSGNSPSKSTPDHKGKFSKTSNFKGKPVLLSNETKGNSNNTAEKKPDSKCFLCSNSHSLLDCSVFYTLTPEGRVHRLKHYKGCKNCLNSQHTTQNCRSKWHCRFCSNRHNSMLHIHSESDQSSSRVPTVPLGTKTSKESTSTSLNSTISDDNQIQIILGTAVVHFMDSRGQYQPFRIVLDSGSQQSFMTSKCFNKLGSSMQRHTRKISATGGSLFEGAKGKVFCTLRSADGSSNFSTDAVVVKNITNYLPISPVPYDIWKHYVNFSLADQVLGTSANRLSSRSGSLW